MYKVIAAIAGMVAAFGVSYTVKKKFGDKLVDDLCRQLELNSPYKIPRDNEDVETDPDKKTYRDIDPTFRVTDDGVIILRDVNCIADYYLVDWIVIKYDYETELFHVGNKRFDGKCGNDMIAMVKGTKLVDWINPEENDGLPFELDEFYHVFRKGVDWYLRNIRESYEDVIRDTVLRDLGVKKDPEETFTAQDVTDAVLGKDLPNIPADANGVPDCAGPDCTRCGLTCEHRQAVYGDLDEDDDKDQNPNVPHGLADMIHTGQQYGAPGYTADTSKPEADKEAPTCGGPECAMCMNECDRRVLPFGYTGDDDDDAKPTQEVEHETVEVKPKRKSSGTKKSTKSRKKKDEVAAE